MATVAQLNESITRLETKTQEVKDFLVGQASNPIPDESVARINAAVQSLDLAIHPPAPLDGSH